MPLKVKSLLQKKYLNGPILMVSAYGGARGVLKVHFTPWSIIKGGLIR